MSKRSERKIVSKCYGHLGGRLGETLFKFVVQEKWIVKGDTERDYEITERGWKELDGLGIDVEKLRETSRKMVVPCAERHGGAFYPHTGAYLGELLKNRLLELEWLEKREEKLFEVTDRGLKGLTSMGIEMGELG
ncbi:MAG: hypothetical protein ACE5QF_09550 [Thermoplasmata archaeon]